MATPEMGAVAPSRGSAVTVNCRSTPSRPRIEKVPWTGLRSRTATAQRQLVGSQRPPVRMSRRPQPGPLLQGQLVALLVAVPEQELGRLVEVLEAPVLVDEEQRGGQITGDLLEQDDLDRRPGHARAPPCRPSVSVVPSDAGANSKGQSRSSAAAENRRSSWASLVARSW